MESAEEWDVSAAPVFPWHKPEEKVCLSCGPRDGVCRIAQMCRRQQGRCPKTATSNSQELNEKCGVGIKEKSDLPCEQQYQVQKVQ